MVVQELFNEINVKGGNLQIELNRVCYYILKIC